MNRNENEAESFAGNFMAFGEEALFFEVPTNPTLNVLAGAIYGPRASGSVMQVNRDKSSARNASGPKGEAQMFNNFADMQTMSKANMDATMKSFEAVTKSTQAIVTEIADYSRRSIEIGAKAAEKMIGAKSLDKAFEVQSEYAKAACEDYVSEVTKLGELYADLAKETFKPYQDFAARMTPTR